MRKLWNVLLVMAVLLGFSGCGSNASENLPEQTTQIATEAVGQPIVDGFGFVFQDVRLIPGNDFVAGKFPLPHYTYTRINSVSGIEETFCNYTDIEVSVYQDGKSSVILSIIVISPNLETPEGLSLGDPLEEVTKLYGSNYTQDGDMWLFGKGNTVLAVLTQDGFVAGIEYRLTGI